MYPFTYTRATSEREAIEAGQSGGRYLAGGTTLVDLMRETVEQPGHIVDINALPYREIRLTAQRLHVGALVRMSDLASHPDVVKRFPVISQALLLSASAQLRNMASIGGNLLQRTRCGYFRDVSASCNKRQPGSGCAAINGENRVHAILGGSEQCVATHPSDLAVALVALEAVVLLRDANGERDLPIERLFRLPGTTPDQEHDLRPGELITGIEVPVTRHAERSGYLKVRDRESYEFAITSAAVALQVELGTIVAARVAAGGVGTMPWRLREVETALIGRRASSQTWQDAARHAMAGAKPLSNNAFKVSLLERTVARQLEVVGGGQ